MVQNGDFLSDDVDDDDGDDVDDDYYDKNDDFDDVDKDNKDNQNPYNDSKTEKGFLGHLKKSFYAIICNFKRSFVCGIFFGIFNEFNCYE